MRFKFEKDISGSFELSKVEGLLKQKRLCEVKREGDEIRFETRTMLGMWTFNKNYFVDEGYIHYDGHSQNLYYESSSDRIYIFYMISFIFLVLGSFLYSILIFSTVSVIAYVGQRSFFREIIKYGSALKN